MEFCWAYITCKDGAEARKIGKALVQERKVACVNIWEGMTSMYEWEGQLMEDQECVLIAKTHADQQEGLIARVEELHSYEVPCVVFLPILGGNPKYLNWIQQEINKQPIST